MTSLQQTLVVLKPDAVQRGLIGRLVARFEDAGLKVVAARMLVMDDEFIRRHYADLEERLGSGIYHANAAFMRRGPVFALVLEGVDAVRNVRRLVGSTYPSEAQPGTIRGDFAHQTKAHCDAQGTTVFNLVHASGNAEEAEYEVALWFSAEERFTYPTLAEAFTF